MFYATVDCHHAFSKPWLGLQLQLQTFQLQTELEARDREIWKTNWGRHIFQIKAAAVVAAGWITT